MAVVKVRASAHSKDLRLFEITADGIVVGERIGDYQGLLTGSPHVALRQRQRPRRRSAATAAEVAMHEVFTGAAFEEGFA